jgi:hypothetical protein
MSEKAYNFNGNNSQINIDNKLHDRAKIEQINYSLNEKEILSTLNKARELLRKVDDTDFIERVTEYIDDFESGIKEKNIKPKVMDRIKNFCSKAKDYSGEHKFEICQLLMSTVQTYAIYYPPTIG